MSKPTVQEFAGALSALLAMIPTPRPGAHKSSYDRTVAQMRLDKISHARDLIARYNASQKEQNDGK